MSTPSEEQVQEQYDEAIQVSASGGPDPYPAMTYHEGVRDALGWVLGEREEPPVEMEEGQ